MELLFSSPAFSTQVTPAAAAGAAPGRLSCRGCALAALCLAGAAPDDAPGNRCLVRRRRLRRGERLFRAGEPHAGTLFTVRRGSFKTSLACRYGDQQVTGFYLHAELPGLDALGLAHHRETATALEPSEVCEIAADAGSIARHGPPWLPGALRRAAVHAIAREEATALALRNTSAERRLAAFLLDLAERHAAGGATARPFRLTMSRVEIASFLGLTPETVSRLMSSFRRLDLLRLDLRALSLSDPSGLHALARDGVLPPARRAAAGLAA